MLFAALAAAGAQPKPYAGRVLVAVTAHADDWSIFAGGAIAKMIDEGYTGYLIRVTDDEKDGVTSAPENSLRNGREIYDAARILGIREIFSLNLKNDEIDPFWETELREKLILLIRKLKPYTVFTFDPWASYEENPDHLKTAKAVDDACWTAQIGLFHPEQLRAGLEPHYCTELYYWARGPHVVNKVVDISSTLDRKIEAVRAHRGMIRDPRILVDLREANQKLGELHKLRAAELFHYVGLTSPGDYVSRNARSMR
jgi:LmbE family N-acetylglucosaminyl deacetylase